MSAVENLAPGVDTSGFRSSFMISMSAVGVPTSAGYLILSPPTTNRAELGSVFSYR